MKRTMNLIDKELVHKNSHDNVLIYNLRRSVPHFISGSDYDSVYQRLDYEKRLLLDKCYIPVYSENIAFLSDMSKKFYMLRSIILEISSKQAEEIADNLAVQDQAFFFLLYEPVCNETKLRLFRDISEEEEKHVLKVLGLKEFEISEDMKYEISSVFEEHEEIAKNNIVYSKMFVNINHRFFFEHSNDHVPGFMLIEAFRQFCVAVNHVYGKVPLKDAQLVLECLDSKFFKYVELSLPVTLKGIVKESRWNKKGYLSFLDFETEVIQGSSILARLRIYGKIISKGVFARMRRIESERLQRVYRYKLTTELSTSFELVGISSNNHVTAEIVNFSIDGFMVSSEYFSRRNEETAFNFTFYCEQVGFICGSCEKKWEESQERRAGMQIVEIDDVSMKRLKTVLSKYCYVYDRDEIL